MSDPDSVAARTVHRGTERLLRHLTLFGLFVEDRAPARERAQAELGDLAALCVPPEAGGSESIEPGQAA